MRPAAAWRAALELGKPRLSSLVLLTAAVGYLLGSAGPVRWGTLVAAMVGTALSAFGANALNQWYEASRDARMRRTARRPVPSGRLSAAAALAVALSAAAGGPAVLWLGAGLIPAGLALAAIGVYVLLYTPLKPLTTWNTLVGAIVGALPPMIGWSAAAGSLAAGAWILGGILFLWQVPHFLALAWMYREDYARGGLRMLPMVDPSGHLTGCLVVVYSLVLLALAPCLALASDLGWAYVAGSLLLGAAFLATSLWLERERSVAAAKRTFLVSMIYLSLLLGLMILDRHPADVGGDYAAAGAPGAEVTVREPA